MYLRLHLANLINLESMGAKLVKILNYFVLL